ncbi:FAD-dependent oxidoreductase [Anaerophaga thermohalophila]|uniref:FAD-dependent oxidoreductase n=1 Tax=Anaerophaga thermohalophila TaxID=177400 RepID=UPI000237C446|nr:FAD-dependent oxidoreductase [Anaerophaga thermohalophila]
MNNTKYIILFSLLFSFFFTSCTKRNSYDVLVVGGGASGSMAGIQSARMGAETLIVEEGPWLGGMLTSAGVSAIDGNYNLHSGLWEEFRQKLYDYYGGSDSVKTGWVSNVLFEPSVGEKLIREMAMNEPNLDLVFNTKLDTLEKTDNGWLLQLVGPDGTMTVEASVVIDGTELGDVAKMAGIPYDIGMDSRYETGEDIAPEKSNDIVQDMTYVAVLQDFGKDADKTIDRPENYDPSPFFCTCRGVCDPDTISRTLWPCDKMMEYGKLPNDKYMINWPIYGNDYYLNVIEMTPEEREEAYQEAKWFTRCYIYYLQTELEFNHLGIADDEFPTEDGFPLIPYHRESRRIKGKVTFTVNDLARPFDQERPLYRTGIAVGDYPIDHHHAAYPDQSKVPDLHFYPVPSYSLPLGTLIPKSTEDFIVAEKSISVTNIVNGTTRLQPVCILIGQAAGTLAALAVKDDVTPSEVPVREVQSHLLKAGAYLMPYSDVTPEDAFWEDVQKIGATGIIRGEGKNIGWSNVTLFHPDSVMTAEALKIGLNDFVPEMDYTFKNETLSVEEGISIAYELAEYLGKETAGNDQLKTGQNIWKELNYGTFNPEADLTRSQMAALLSRIADPFSVDVNIKGRIY